MSDDPQAGVRSGYWMAHDGPVHMSNMCDEHVLNAYHTCIRHNNSTKADELLTELEHRDIDWRV